MTKIPFNIKYRVQIESGEYRVVTREDRPVEIRIWELKGDFPVVGVYFDEKNNRETAVQVTAEGRCSIKPSDDYCDDFFITTNKSVMWSQEDEEILNGLIEENTYGELPENPDKIVIQSYEKCCKRVDWLKSLKNKVTLQPQKEWTENDSHLLTESIYLLSILKMENRSDGEFQKAEWCISWLKSLEDRVFPQPRQEWTEEDEVCYISIMEHLKYSITNGKPETYTNGRLTDWIEKRAKFLRPQNHRKPSKEQIKSVWHEPDEKPFDKSKVVVWTGEEMVQCSYIFGKFKEKTPTEEHGRYVDVGNREDPGSVFISKRSRADLTDLVVKWAYIDDLLNNPDKKEPVSEDLEKEIDRIWRKIPDSLSDTIYWKEFDKIARHFANWQKQQLMKGAISAEIFDNYDKDICQHHMEILADIPDGYKDGEKVKLVIIKED